MFCSSRNRLCQRNFPGHMPCIQFDRVQADSALLGTACTNSCHPRPRKIQQGKMNSQSTYLNLMKSQLGIGSKFWHQQSL
mmetsp:Transcript_28142/g.50293  ORF Transcript_28142/g.50293 Transcript_28142/m.50293 type:complete len:80 (-) Transcript_28142:29-268(-)